MMRNLDVILEMLDKMLDDKFEQLLDKIFNPNNPINNDLMSLKEVTEYLSVTRQTVYRWIEIRKVTGVRKGTHWYFDRREIKRLRQERLLYANRLMY